MRCERLIFMRLAAASIASSSWTGRQNEAWSTPPARMRIFHGKRLTRFPIAATTPGPHHSGRCDDHFEPTRSSAGACSSVLTHRIAGRLACGSMSPSSIAFA